FQDRFEEAKPFYEAAIRLQTDLLNQQLENREYKQELATFTNNLSLLFFEDQQYEMAAQTNRQSLDLMERLVEPALSLGIQLANAHNARCEILLFKGAPREADRECDEALRRLKNLQKSRSFHPSTDFKKAM